MRHRDICSQSIPESPISWLGHLGSILGWKMNSAWNSLYGDTHEAIPLVTPQSLLLTLTLTLVSAKSYLPSGGKWWFLNKDMDSTWNFLFGDNHEDIPQNRLWPNVFDPDDPIFTPQVLFLDQDSGGSSWVEIRSPHKIPFSGTPMKAYLAGHPDQLPLWPYSDPKTPNSSQGSRWWILSLNLNSA